MADGITLLLIKNGETTDISTLTESVRWQGRRGASARSLTATLIDDDGHQHTRAGVDATEGHQCIFLYRGEELFRGPIMNQRQTHRKQLRFTAHDNGIYLANNMDTFCYENRTASDIFMDVCNRFGIPYEEVARCSYVIPNLTKPQTTAFDAICDALSLDYENTGIRHYVSSQKGKLRLFERRDNILQWVIEGGTNLYNYTYTRSIDKIKTRIKLISDEGTVLAEKADAALEGKIGRFQDIIRPDETLTAAQLTQMVESMLTERSTPERSLSVSALGIPEVISGVGVYIIIEHLGLARSFYVDEDTHTFNDRGHTMALTLNYTSDIGISSAPAPAQPGEDAPQEFAVGDLVEFKPGAEHYYPSIKIPSWVKDDYYHIVTQTEYGGKPVTKGGATCVLLGKKQSKGGGAAIAGINTWTDITVIQRV